MNEFKVADAEIIRMIESGSFDKTRAETLLQGVDLNSPINKGSFSTTYLYEAVQENNLQAVEFLLEHGADPNFCNLELIGDCPLWELQYIDPSQDWKTRFEIAKLFFKHGADPYLRFDLDCLYDYVLFKVYNDTPLDDNDWENLRHFYMLLVLYGGGNNEDSYHSPELKNVDLSKIDEYEILLSEHDDGYHIIGELVDGEGNVLGRL